MNKVLFLYIVSSFITILINFLYIYLLFIILFVHLLLLHIKHLNRFLYLIYLVSLYLSLDCVIFVILRLLKKLILNCYHVGNVTYNCIMHHRILVDYL